MNIYLSLKSYSGKAPLWAWMKTIAVRCAYAYWKNQKGKTSIPMEGMGENHKKLISKILFQKDIESHLVLEEKQATYELVHEILDRLSPEDRMVMRLIHIDRYSAKEAAALLGWSRANVLVRAHRSRKKFRRILEAEVFHA